MGSEEISREHSFFAPLIFSRCLVFSSRMLGQDFASYQFSEELARKIKIQDTKNTQQHPISRKSSEWFDFIFNREFRPVPH